MCSCSCASYFEFLRHVQPPLRDSSVSWSNLSLAASKLPSHACLCICIHLSPMLQQHASSSALRRCSVGISHTHFQTIKPRPLGRCQHCSIAMHIQPMFVAQALLPQAPFHHHRCHFLRLHLNQSLYPALNPVSVSCILHPTPLNCIVRPWPSPEPCMQLAWYVCMASSTT